MAVVVKTGKICKVSGKYQCYKHLQEQTFIEGDLIPICKNEGGHETLWALVTPLIKNLKYNKVLGEKR